MNRKANWLTVAGAKRVRTAHDDRQTGVSGARRFKFRQRKPLRSVSKRRQSVNVIYRREATAFVAAAIARGEVCPVVEQILPLRGGIKYGHPISNRLNEVHHMRGRAGALLLDKRHWMAVSKQGHRWIGENPAEARRRGWLCAEGLFNVPDRS